MDDAEVAEFLQTAVDQQRIPGAVAARRREGRTQTWTVGVQDLQTRAPMRTDTLFALSSMTKPIAAALTLSLVADALLELQDPITRWLPELADQRVLRSPTGELDATVERVGEATVEDLLTSRCGLGMTGDFSAPIMSVLVERLQEGPYPRTLTEQQWLQAAASLPLAHQPGQGWTYQTPFVLLGLLLQRASGRDLAVLSRERLFAPSGMDDARWWVEPAARNRLASRYGIQQGRLQPEDRDPDPFLTPPPMPDAASGLIGTVGDWLAFATMLLAGGVGPRGRVLPTELVQRLTTNAITEEQLRQGGVFLEGEQGWAYGGSTRDDGSYGWAGGLGTTGRLHTGTGEVVVLLTQVGMEGPESAELLARFEGLLDPG